MNFLKKSLVLASVIASAAVSAQPFPNYKCERSPEVMVVPCPKAKFLMDGFYLGGQIGYDSYWVRENISLPGGALSGHTKINAPGWVGGLFAGYGQYFGAFYIGAEAFGNYSQANESYLINTPTIAYSAKFNARWSAGIAVLPGLGMTDSSLVYVRLGYNWLSARSDETFGGTSIERTATVGGINYGLGLETLIVDNWSARAEYTHTNYSSFTTDLNSNFDPSDNQVMAAIIFHFSC